MKSKNAHYISLTGKSTLIECSLCASVLTERTHDVLERCLDCGHIFARNDLSYDAIQNLYGFDYFNGDEYLDYLSEEESLKKNYRLRNRELSPHVNLSKSSLLEIGCAYGFYIEESRSQFERLRGIDIARDAIAFGVKERGLNLEYADFLTHDFKGENFDVIVMWDTIEHLPDPRQFVAKIHALLNPGGVLAFTTGDISALVPRLRGRKWRMIHPPTHLHYFNPKSVSAFLDRAGFDILSIQHNGVYRTLGNITHNLFVLRYKWPLIERLVKILRLSRVEIYVNTFDIMTVISRKK